MRACGARPGPAAAEATGRWAALPGSRRPPCPVPCAAVAPGDLSSGQWPVWVRGGPLRHLLHPAPSRLQPQPLPPPGPPRRVLGGGPGPRGWRRPPHRRARGRPVGAGSPAGPCAWRNGSREAGCSVCWLLRPPRTPRPPRPAGRDGRRMSRRQAGPGRGRQAAFPEEEKPSGAGARRAAGGPAAASAPREAQSTARLGHGGGRGPSGAGRALRVTVLARVGCSAAPDES